MVKDMELSCDESVIREAKEDIRTEYSRTLLNVSMQQSGLLLPIAFGDSNTKTRIKNILNFRKPKMYISIAGCIILIVASVTLLTTEKYKETNDSSTKQLKHYEKVNTAEVTNMLQELVNYRTPYIGDNSKISALLNALEVPENLEYDHMELQTKKEPYELTVYYQLNKGVTLTAKAKDTLVLNAILLFSTVENMDVCRFHITTTEENYNLVYDRTDVENALGKLYPRTAHMNDMYALKDIITDYVQYLKLDDSISKAILEFNKDSYKPGEFCTEAHYLMSVEKNENTVTAYTMILYQEYGYEDGEFKDVSGCSMPVANHFHKKRFW
ncbi:DUF4825 domain-containing protein [Anaeromicropila herbilytica]|uniref:DUF4825 domain-containing protein n=1 Tax=Anaeromicropila herbilytica TaxID=2785025 RepID=A0A7R7ID83_9FIRM|nr:DUF4825 domain-containing protein [Anaeromicropila herbilytica]BCN30769.1 hypothetical protein bsdtb5_20640 [Anaeromicropila herbilytica]